MGPPPNLLSPPQWISLARGRSPFPPAELCCFLQIHFTLWTSLCSPPKGTEGDFPPVPSLLASQYVYEGVTIFSSEELIVPLSSLPLTIIILSFCPLTTLKMCISGLYPLLVLFFLINCPSLLNLEILLLHFINMFLPPFFVSLL